MGRIVEFNSGREQHAASPNEVKKGRLPKTRPGNAASSRLTQRLINEVTPPENGKLRIPDGEVSGLFLRVTPNDAKSFILRYTIDGRRGEATIGDAKSITLAAAHARAVDMLGELAVRKIDPIAAKQAAIRKEKTRKNESFEALVALYKTDGQRRKRASSIKQETWILEKHVLPRIGKLRYADFRRPDIIRLIETIGETGGPIIANRSHAMVRQVLNYALKRDLIPANPALFIDRLFPEVSRDRVLSDSELQKFWWFLEAARNEDGTGILPDEFRGERAINGLAPPTATGLQIALLTLQRVGEVTGARIEEFSWTDRLWVIPAERMKGRRAHAVPLSDLAMERFREAFDRSRSDFAFVDRTGHASLERARLTRAMSRVCQRAGIAHASPHDLRRTGRTMLTSERIGVTYDAAERVIAHLVGSSVSRVYDRNEYIREKRAALVAWETELKRIVGY